MKLKLDENLPNELVDLLTSRHHDVDTVASENLKGFSDAIIFHAASAGNRILWTQDLDFSDIRKFKPGTHPGIVLIRLRNPSRRQLLQRVRQILDQGSIDAWSHCFVVISDKKLRVRSP